MYKCSYSGVDLCQSSSLILCGSPHCLHLHLLTVTAQSDQHRAGSLSPLTMARCKSPSCVIAIQQWEGRQRKAVFSLHPDV